MYARVARIPRGFLVQNLDGELILFLLIVGRAEIIKLIAKRILARKGTEAPNGGSEIFLDEIHAAQVVCGEAGGILSGEHPLQQRARPSVVAKFEVANGELLAGLRQGRVGKECISRRL